MRILPKMRLAPLGSRLQIAGFAAGIVVVLAGPLAPVASLAADVPVRVQPIIHNPPTARVIPRRRAAQAVWNADACWRACTQQCNRDLRARLAVQASGKALAQTGRCDRACHADCRLSGGPLVDFID